MFFENKDPDQTEKIGVLIAEDSFLVATMIQEILERTGYRVVAVSANGREAVEMTHKLEPDVVIMDIEMPDMDGIEATEKIVSECPTPVVILTAYESPELVNRASQAGAGAYLIKPPTVQQLDRAITIARARFQDLLAIRHYANELELRNRQLEEALDQVKTLSGLLPICASCKKIRDDRGYWHQVEAYIREHTTVEFSHGICPDCFVKLYPDLVED